MRLTSSLISAAICYALAFALMLYFISKSKTNLVEGEQLPYTRGIDFYVKAGTKTAEHFIVTPELAKGIEERLAFKMDSSSTFQTSSIQVNPQEVSWKSGKTRYVVAGGRINFAGNLTAAGAAGDLEQALLIVLPQLPEGEWAFPNGGARGSGLERVVKHFHVFKDAAAVKSANQASAAKCAGSLALLVWGVWMMIAAWRAKRRLDATSEPLAQVQLPRTFEPGTPNVARSFGLAAMIGGIIALILAMVGLEDAGSHLSDQLATYPTLAALAVALLFAWIATRRIVGAEVSTESLALTRGGGSRREMSWADIDSAKPVEVRNRSGQLQHEYVDILAPTTGQKKIRIHSTQIAQYHLFRDLVSSLWQSKHPSSPAARGV